MSKNAEFLAKRKLAEQRERLKEIKKNVLEESILKPIDPKLLITEDLVINTLTRLSEFNKVEDIKVKAGMKEDELFYVINSMLEEAGCDYSLYVDKGCGAKGIATAINAMINKKDKNHDGKRKVL